MGNKSESFGINLSEIKEDLSVPVPTEDIVIPRTPLYCLQNLAANKKKLNLDATDKAKLFDLLVELSDRSAQLGVNRALTEWTGKDYKLRDDWENKYGEGRSYYSLRVHNKSAFRVCNTQNDLSENASSVVFRVWDVVNEKN
ncbi:MAG: hypothetical protein PHI11_04230 [Gallionella sp.]|nr:hypothetical protein [Gallionella sp.]